MSAYVTSINQEPVYESTAQMFVAQPPREELSDLGYLSGYQLIQTYIQLIKTDQVLTEVGFRLDYFISRENITVQQIRDTQIITVKVEDSDPYKASEFANTLVQVFAEQQYLSQTSRYVESKLNLESNLKEQAQIIDNNSDLLESLPKTDANQAERDRLETLLAQARETYTKLLQSYENIRISEAQSISHIELAEPAKADLDPVRPRILTNTLLGAVVGLMIAGGIVFLIEYLDDTVSAPEEVVDILNLSSLGFIAEMQHSGKNGRGEIYVSSNPRSPIAEAFRSLRTNIAFASSDSPFKTILITSPGPMEGKSTIAANLAHVMVQGGKRVAVVDCDLRRPRVHQLFDLNNRVGLSELFRGTAEFLSVIQEKNEDLLVVTSGKLPPNPAELLDSEALDRFLDSISSVVDVVIVDSPPVIVTDPIVVSSKVDGVLLIVRPGQTKLNSLKVAIDQIEHAGARVIGLVFNRISRHNAYYYKDYNQNYYYQGNEDRSSKLEETTEGHKRG